MRREEDYEEVETTGVWDYSWNEAKLLREKATGQLFWAEASGCSCYGFWEVVGDEDFVPVATWQEWADKAQQWAGGDDNWLEASEKKGAMDAIERLNQSRPEPSPKTADA